MADEVTGGASGSLGDAFVAIGANLSGLEQGLEQAHQKTVLSLKRTNQAARVNFGQIALQQAAAMVPQPPPLPPVVPSGPSLFDSIKSGGMKGLGGVMPFAIGGGIAGVAASASAYAVQELVGLMREVASEAAQAEEAQHKLKMAVVTFGGASADTARELSEYANQLQRTTVYGDETIKTAMAMGMQIGLNADQMKEATKAAIGLSAKLNIDVSTAMQGLARLQNGGSARWLTMYGIVEKNATIQEQYNQAIRAGTEAFRLAESAATTMSGAHTRMKNGYGEVKEALGLFVGESVGATDSMNKFADNAFRFADRLSAAAELVGPALHMLSHSVKGVIDVAMGDMPSAIKNVEDWVQHLKGDGEEADKAGKAHKRRGDEIEEASRKEKAAFGSASDAWKRQQLAIGPGAAPDAAKPIAFGTESVKGGFKAGMAFVPESGYQRVLTEIRDAVHALRQATEGELRKPAVI